MTIQYKTGCIIDAAKNGEFDILLHQANCFHTMNSGVAKNIRVNFPEAYAADLETEKGNPDKLGTISYGIVDDWDIIVANLYGQFRYGTDRQYTNYEALEKCFINVAGFLSGFDPNTRIGTVRLGCGTGGGDWNIVLPMLEKRLGHYPITIYEINRG